MTDSPTRADLIESARKDAAAFRTHPVYDSEGDGFLLTVVADRIDSYAAALAADAERIAVLEGVALDVGASLAAAISLLERCGKAAKKAAPSDKMFDQMVEDYKASLNRARAQIEGHRT